AQHPGWRRVVVERALEGIDDLIVQRWLGLLRESPHKDLDRLRFSHAPNALGSDDVDHAGSEPAIGNDGYALLPRSRVQRALLLDDLRVSAEVGVMQTGGDRRLGDGIIEVVGERVHDGVMAL